MALVTKYLSGKGPLMVKVDSAVAAKTPIFDDGEHGTIKHIWWLGVTTTHLASLVNDDGDPIFKFEAITGNLSPTFLNIDLNFANGLYCDDLDSGTLWLVLSVILPKAATLKV